MIEGGAVYHFPVEPEEQNLWEKVLPNKLRDEVKDRDGKIKKTISVYYKHYPLTVRSSKNEAGS